MILEFLSLNGHGLYVWLSFSIALISCSFIYLRTKKTLKKYEREYLEEFQSLNFFEKKEILKKSKIANQIYATSSKAN